MYKYFIFISNMLFIYFIIYNLELYKVYDSTSYIINLIIYYYILLSIDYRICIYINFSCVCICLHIHAYTHCVMRELMLVVKTGIKVGWWWRMPLKPAPGR